MTQGECQICQGQLCGDSYPLPVYRDSLWNVRHSQETDIAGYLVLESRRHFLDLSEADEAEVDSFGALLAAIVRALRRVVPCERVYTVTLAEKVPHFHVHIIPRTRFMPPAYRGRGILSYPLVPGANESLANSVCASLRLALRRAGYRQQ